MVWFMEFNATFNNIFVISRRSVLLMEETGVPRKKPTNLSQVTDNLYHIILYRIHIVMNGVQTHNFSSDYTGSCKSNYHAITTRTVTRNDNGRTPLINHHMINSCFAENASTVLGDQGYYLTNGTTNCPRRV